MKYADGSKWFYGEVYLGISETPPQSPEIALPKPYERKLSFLQRIFKVLFSPREGMEDVALAPSYGEVFRIIAIQVFVALIFLALIFSKIQFVGLNLPPAFWAILMFAVVIAVIFTYGLIVAVWLIISVIVKFACNKGSGWDLKSAASITGYTFLVDTIVGFASLATFWFFIPLIKIDVTNLELARQFIANLRAQLNWLWLCWLPVSILGIVWKSYLGGLGANFGTSGKCPIKLGFAVFSCIGLVGLLISVASYILQ